MGAIAATYHLFQTASSGDPTQRDDIGYLRAKSFKITTDPPQKVVVDGEMLGTTPIKVRDLLFNKIPGFAWRGEAAPSETWDFIGILFYGKPLSCVPEGLTVLVPLVEEEVPTENLEGLPNLVVEVKEDVSV
jgi:hypothetical protein